MIHKLKISLAILILFSLACKKGESQSNGTTDSKLENSSTSNQTSAVVIFVVGDVRTNDKKLSLGDTITESDVLLTGKKSLCDMQILDSDSGVVIRVKADSEFSLSPSNLPDKKEVNLVLRKGTALFKINNKLPKNHKVSVTMPTMVAGVRGTSFSAKINNSGDVDLQVLEGAVATRPNISEIEALPDELKTKSQAVNALVTTLQNKEQIIEAGQKVTITKTYTDQILKDTGLRESLPKIKESLKKGDISAASQKLDEGIKSPEEVKTKIVDKVASQSPIKVESSNNKDVQTQLKEFEELIAIEKQKLESETSRKTEISVRTKERKESLLKRIEEITGKSTETLILKNGNRIQGVIIQEGTNYHVLTTEGKKTFKQSEVDGTEF